ncbi:unnamed protein product [Diabrotica balteata]|uniref:Uncharacterized protein n=1 Tax=Diabrotica balteata TaxID=107213 RepID=A0A9N9T8Q3_DIABA|nr:unnamed protein product [Diabrotica balteata]
MQSSSSSRKSKIMALAKKIKSERYAPDQVRNSEVSERFFLSEENAALVSYDNANYVIATDNDNNKLDTSLLRVDLLPKRKDEFQISDFVSNNDDDLIKNPNYESNFGSSSSFSSFTLNDSSSSSSYYSPGCNSFLGWWFVVFTVTLVACIISIREVYKKWLRAPVIVSFATKETPIYSIPFPAVTICPETKSTQALYSHMGIVKKFLNKQNLTERE